MKTKSQSMKKSLILFALLCANYSISQNSSNELEKKSAKAQTVVSSEKKEAFNASIQKQIQQVDSHLNSIQIKWNYIQNDPAENQLAIDNGWFDDMTAIKNKLAAKKQQLTDSLK